MPKFIREGRFGRPKTFKTGSILGNKKKGIISYPKPILYLGFDAGGHEICPDIKSEDVLSYKDFRARLELPMEKQADITVVDFSFKATEQLEELYKPAKDTLVWEEFVALTNKLVTQFRGKPFPFATVVLDPVTELTQAVYRHLAVTNSGTLGDARKWASAIGMKIQQVIDYLCGLPCNVVFLFHTDVDKNEDTKVIDERPMVYSSLKDYVGGKFSQFFYQGMYSGRPVIYLKAFEYVKGIGARWPDFDDATRLDGCTFDVIYSREPDVYNPMKK